jgi:hypothetical protein
MNDGNESFARRWSRLKREQGNPDAREPDAQDEPPALPSLDELTPESDFSAFMHPKVDPDLRQAALRKLFAGERYQTMDGLDVYIGDYSTPDPLPPAMLAGLAHVATLLRRDQEKESRPRDEPDGAKAADGARPAERDAGTAGAGDTTNARDGRTQTPKSAARASVPSAIGTPARGKDVG